MDRKSRREVKGREDEDDIMDCIFGSGDMRELPTFTGDSEKIYTFIESSIAAVTRLFS